MRTRDILRAGGAALTAAWWIAGAAAAPGAQPNQAPPELWLAPSGAADPARSPFALAVANFNNGKPAAAEPVFAKAVGDPVLGGYARLYLGRAQLAAGRAGDASSTAQQLLRAAPLGRLNEAALWLAADAADDAKDWPTEIRALQWLTGLAASAAPERAWLQLGRTELKAGDRQRALEAFAKVYYEFALTDQAGDAADEMKKLVAAPFLPTPDSYTLDLGRAQQLYGARHYTDARKAFDALRPLAKGPDRALISLRLAECDYGLRRYSAARDGVLAYLDQNVTDATEAQFFYIATLRELGHGDAYVAAAQAFVDQHPGEQFAEDTLNDLGSYYIRQDDDGKAAAVFTQLIQRFPTGPHADRAAWKAGWWAFRNTDYATTIGTFQTAAVQLRRSDYRPMWLYWTARAQAASGDREGARLTYRAVVTDYRNSYYGREATRALEQFRAPAGPSAPSPVSPARREMPPTITAGPPPSNATLVRALLAAGLYDDAIAELKAAQRESGTSPIIEATIAYALNRRGDLRPGITAMRHAYPQFIAEGGEALPTSILTVIFPVDYWSLIYKYATARSLDPYLMAALIAQESTFEADVKSTANAWGLMQVLPSTGRQYAARLGIKPFRTARLTEPETNIRIGMAYFADLVRQFGSVAPALAAYNAGDDRASRWLAERPGLSRDEFIDDIPFPETQNYVKRIIGQAEDYRLLYRRPSPDAAPHHAGAGPGREP